MTTGREGGAGGGVRWAWRPSAVCWQKPRPQSVDPRHLSGREPSADDPRHMSPSHTAPDAAPLSGAPGANVARRARLISIQRPPGPGGTARRGRAGRQVPRRAGLSRTDLLPLPPVTALVC